MQLCELSVDYLLANIYIAYHLLNIVQACLGNARVYLHVHCVIGVSVSQPHTSLFNCDLYRLSM